jgi:hypothetical protein
LLGRASNWSISGQLLTIPKHRNVQVYTVPQYILGDEPPITFRFYLSRPELPQRDLGRLSKFCPCVGVFYYSGSKSTGSVFHNVVPVVVRPLVTAQILSQQTSWNSDMYFPSRQASYLNSPRHADKDLQRHDGSKARKYTKIWKRPVQTISVWARKGLVDGRGVMGHATRALSVRDMERTRHLLCNLSGLDY